MAESGSDSGSSATSVLVLRERSGERDHCDRLVAGTDVTASLQVRIPDATESSPDPPDAVDRFGLVSVGSGDSVASVDDEPAFDDPVVIDPVSDPTDLEAIGVSVSRFCDRWADETLAVCVDSLDPLFDHHEAKTVFEFTYYVLRRLESVDAFAHLHLDPRTHDEAVVRSFGDLVDRVVEDPHDRSTDESTDPDEASDPATSPRSEDADESSSTRSAPASEATDEEVAELLGEHTDVDESPDTVQPPSRPDEATDADLDRLFSD